MKNFVFVISVMLVALVSSSFTASHTHHDCSPVSTEFAAMGKHCNGYFGCDCPGFSPKTDGYEYQKAYCKHCGHKKTYHH